MGVVKKIAGDMADHAKTQHEITKARHANAKMSPKEKQQAELANLKAQKQY